MINTPTILGEEAYDLNPQQAQDINTIQINADYDITAALGRGLATHYSLIDDILNFLPPLSPGGWKLNKMAISLFTNQFYEDSKVKVTYKDQIEWYKLPPGGFVNHHGNWDENFKVWFEQIKNKIK